MSVSEISKESVLNRVLRENALAALMVVLTVIGLVNGLIIGLGIATMTAQADKYETLRVQYEVNNVWLSRLIGELQSKGIEVPEREEKEE